VATAALFDVDGTLIARNSAPLYMRHLRRTGRARRRDLLRTFYFVARYKLGLLDIERATATSLGWIRGRDEALVRADCDAWYGREIRRWIVPAMAAAVEEHRRAGHLLAIVTSATRYLAEPLAADLGIPHLLVTQLVVRDGRFTGDLVPPVCYGAGKIHWVERLADRFGVDLARSYFYTDSITDLPLLERVGEPRVVNPDPRLRRLAAQRGWPVLRPRLGSGDAVPASGTETSGTGGGEERWRNVAAGDAGHPGAR
jgi:HAD superfamily hydrolase (TIGR01490 family)